MARPEKPLGSRKSAVVELAGYLREGRRHPYSALAARAGDYSATTLQRAASGQCLPRREVARAYAHACGLDIDRVDRLWEAAYREKQRAERGVSLPQGLPPHLVHNVADLSSALVALHAKHGGPSIRLMHKRARRYEDECMPLSTSTLHRILSRATVPASNAGLRAFLYGCEVPSPQHQLWERAATRARRNHRLDMARAQEAMAVLEAEFADGEGRQLSPEQAKQLLRGAGYRPAEPYHGFSAPWTVRCTTCQGLQRVMLSAAAQGQARCRVCQSTDPNQPDVLS
ncbi:Helix-turn-helix domain-containing protein [Streptomyces sp. Ag109_O5-10]|nr:Helix-turn-helix domain-containing protein [Streptomyces sp. Ag109_O5-10]